MYTVIVGKKAHFFTSRKWAILWARSYAYATTNIVVLCHGHRRLIAFIGRDYIDHRRVIWIPAPVKTTPVPENMTTRYITPDNPAWIKSRMA